MFVLVSEIAELSEFEVDKLYWAVVPDEIVQAQSNLNVWNLYLGNGENGYSEVITGSAFSFITPRHPPCVKYHIPAAGAAAVSSR